MGLDLQSPLDLHMDMWGRVELTFLYIFFILQGDQIASMELGVEENPYKYSYGNLESFNYPGGGLETPLPLWIQIWHTNDNFFIYLVISIFYRGSLIVSREGGRVVNCIETLKGFCLRDSN